jgi:hypothetical protein
VAGLSAVCLEHALGQAWTELDQRHQRLQALQQFTATPTNWPALAAGSSEVAFPGELAGLEVSWRRQDLGLVLAVAAAPQSGRQP